MCQNNTECSLFDWYSLRMYSLHFMAGCKALGEGELMEMSQSSLIVNPFDTVRHSEIFPNEQL